MSNTENQNGKRMHPTVIALGWVSFFTDFSSEMIYPLLPAFLTGPLGAGAAFLGVVEGVADATSSLMKIWAGRASDQLGKRKIFVMLGYAGSSLARPFLSFAQAAWHVLALRFIDRMGKGTRGAPRDALVADLTPPDKRGKAFGYQRAMDHAGAVVGPLAAMALMSWFGVTMRHLFLMASIPAFFSVWIIWKYVRDPENPETTGPKPGVRASIDERSAAMAKNTPAGFAGLSEWLRNSIPGNPRLRRFLVGVGCFSLGNASDGFLLLRAQQLGVPLIHLPLLWAGFHALKSTLSTPLGMLSDKIGRARMIFPGWLLYALVYMGFGFATKLWHAWALFGCYAFFYATTEGVERAFVADLSEPHERGTALGAYQAVLGLAALPASVLFGVLWQGFSPSVAFFTAAGLACAATVWTAAAVVPKAR